MKSRLLTVLAITVLAVSTSAWAQGYIPECRAAKATLVQYAQLANVGTLVKQGCPQIHNGVWLLGTGNINIKDGTPLSSACDPAWSSLTAVPAAYNAGMDFVTRNCPPIYQGLGWRTGPAASAAIPACELAVQYLTAAGVTTQAGNAVNHNCAQIYQNGWLVSLAGTPAGCPAIFTTLTNANMLQPEHDLISHNCPWLYINGYAGVAAPIAP